MRSTANSGVIVFLGCAALALAVVWWTLVEDERESGQGVEATISDSAAATAAEDSDGVAAAPLASDERRSVGPNVVTRVGDRFVWQLDERERRDFLPDLRALADAGWARAVAALAPVVVDCIDDPPESEATLRGYVYGPTIQFTVGEDGEIRQGAPPDNNPEATRAAQDERFRQLTLRNWQKQLICHDAMPANPDRLMDWLELGLEQQPEGFIPAVLEGRLIPEDTAWIVRNAERLAAFNLRLIGVIESRVMQGDPEALGMAWSVLAWGNFTPDPEPLRAYPYALAARMGTTDASGRIPSRSRTQERVEYLLGRPLSEQELSRARERARELYDRCCADMGLQRQSVP
ncbi:MAG: hypothetical protein WD397_14795 [Wenzhouxiangellaceae bacterium]